EEGQRGGVGYSIEPVSFYFSLPSHAQQNTTFPVKTLLTIFCFLALQLNVWAWSGAGHQVIAAEAYRELSPALKSKVSETLKSHPDYEKWKESFTSESPNLDLATFIFMRSSTWPDEIRRRGNKYDHP